MKRRLLAHLRTKRPTTAGTFKPLGIETNMHLLIVSNYGLQQIEVS